jgi:hypothetical protein
MRYHHEPGESDNNELAYIVHTANHIALQCEIGSNMDAALYELASDALDFLSLDEEDLAQYKEATIEAVGQITQSLT